jgi:ATP-dependent helicase HrpA
MSEDLPTITFDEALPITAHVEELSEALSRHQVLVVAGETGSGKTTQLPKICLLAGREHIGHTQPRRIAARSLAARIAEELGESLGQTVGFQVRFARKHSQATRIKVMTDGILLAEISHDRDLRRYDTLIIDEAHERSLNIDFLLGYLKQLLPRRPDLKVIITSATIDTARFAEHFDGAPVVEVSGRGYPVDVWYRPVVDESHRDRDQVDAICAAITELGARDGDILVFCSGEREIRDAAEAINAMDLRFTEVLPLYARLSAAEQHRVFSAHQGRRIVLATNVAETSLTVPGIRYVIDPGFARISRYSARTKVQRLPIEAISQASANQRAGRCGRLGPGICVRLYSEEDFAARPQFTQPEILRTNLASVILQMAAAGLGSISDFPFVEPPDTGQINDGLRLLEELGAIRGGRKQAVALTPIGRRLARLPVDPRLGRMLLEAERFGCLREVLPIVAGIAIPDVRERPAEAQAAADAAHRRFWAPLGADTEAAADGSDIAALLRLWNYLREQRKQLSGNGFRRMCRQEYLHFLRVREWQDLHTQLKEACTELGLRRNDAPADLDAVHTAVLAGLLSHIGLLDQSSVGKGNPGKGSTGRGRGPAQYLGARGARFAINPGSSAARTRAELVMAVELVETSRLWARTVAPITADQVEQVGSHLIKRHYSEPRWSARGGQCVADERLTLLGVPIVAQRMVSYARIDPVTAREVFIMSALVEGQWRTRHHFWARNQAVRAEAEALVERRRRSDLLVDDATIAAFYDARIPPEVVSVAYFDRWWKRVRHDQPALLDLHVDDLVEPGVDLDPGAFPSHWATPVGEVELDYVFEPGNANDGVTVQIPMALLTSLEPEQFTWQVPGLRLETATELIRGLPKALRTQLVPATDTAREALDWLAGQPPVAGESLGQGLTRAIAAVRGVVVAEDHWRPAALPAHLRLRFAVTGAEGVVVADDLPELVKRLTPQIDRSLNRAARGLVHPGATTWEFGELPTQIFEPMPGYPALVDRVDTVAVEVFADPDAAHRAHAAGIRRLIVLTTVDPTKSVVARMSNATKLALGTSPYPSVPALLADARLQVNGHLVAELVDPWQVRTEEVFADLANRVRARAAETLQQSVLSTGQILTLAGQITQLLDTAAPATAADVREQVANLVFPGFLAATPARAWRRLPVYLAAVVRRLETCRSQPGREQTNLELMGELEAEYAAVCDRYPAGPLPAPVADIGWLLEELRVSLFAQQLGTAVPISAKRVRAAMAALAS